MKSRRLVLGSWAIYFILLFCFYFIEMIFMNKDMSVRFMDLTHLVPFFIGILLLATLFFYFEKKHNKENLNLPFIIILSSLFIMFAIVIFLFPEQKEFTVLEELGDYHPSSSTFIYELSLNDKVYFILMAFISCLMSYIYIVLLPKKYYFTRIINPIYYTALVFMTVVMVYSYITEFNMYLEFPKNLFNLGVAGYPKPRSFFLNSNNLGFLYLAMICFTLLVHHQHPRWWYYMIAGILLANSLTVVSKTNFALSVFIFAAYFIGRFFATFKEQKKMNIIAGSIITSIFVALVISVSVSSIFRNEYYLFFERIYLTTFKFDESHFSTFTGRTYLWEMVIDILNQTSWVVGAGHGVFNTLFLEYCSMYWGEHATTMPHNGFMQLLGEGGIIYLIAFFAFIGYVIYKLVRIQKTHKGLAIFEWPMLIVILAHMLFESATPVVFAIPTVDSMIFVFLFALPILNTRFKDKHQEVLKDIAIESEVVKYYNLKEKPLYKANTILFFLTPFVSFLIGITYALFGFNVPLYYFVIILGALFIYIFIPYLFNSNEKFSDYLKHSVWKALLLVFVLAIYYFLFTLWSKSDKSALMFIGFSGGMLYIFLISTIKPLHFLADFLFMLFDNLNTFFIRLYSTFVIKELDHRKAQRLEINR